jgi:hypothetical protein
LFVSPCVLFLFSTQLVLWVGGSSLKVFWKSSWTIVDLFWAIMTSTQNPRSYSSRHCSTYRPVRRLQQMLPLLWPYQWIDWLLRDYRFPYHYIYMPILQLPARWESCSLECIVICRELFDQADYSRMDVLKAVIYLVQFTVWREDSGKYCSHFDHISWLTEFLNSHMKNLVMTMGNAVSAISIQLQLFNGWTLCL